MFLWANVLLITWGLAYSVIAYKDLGTAVRFKLQVLPILLGVIGYLILQPARRLVHGRPARLGVSLVPAAQ